ncbi:MAG: S8 family serine peptidase [Desulfocapsaceae bacterium]|nr:S8 family serine peptidase [Desulfocapsaceae bacterium]
MKKRNVKTIGKAGFFAVTSVAIFGLIVFPAQARNTSALESATPVTALSGDETLKWNMPNDIGELISKMPTVYTNSNTESGTSQINLRGLGTNTTRTLTLVNGRRVINTLPEINPADIQRVEVLTGSSASTVYGSDAVSGVINVITKKPMEESRNSFFNPDSSPYRGNPFQSGYRAMAAADVDPVGQALSAFYADGGKVGIDAGDMFSSTVKLRWNLGGPICDLGTAASWQYQYPSREAAECLTDEMLGYLTTYETSRGTVVADQFGGEYVVRGLNGLGFDSQLATDIARTRFSDVSEFLKEPGDFQYSKFSYGSLTNGTGIAWEITDTLSTNPEYFDHLRNYTSGGKYAMPARDNNPLSLDLWLVESILLAYSQETIQPNDPLFQKEDTPAGKVGSVLKKGFGALLSAGGVGIATTDTDSRSNDQWGLHAVGYTPMGKGTSAWDTFNGREKNVIVAVIDSGLDLSHPDRPQHIWRNSDEIPGNNIDDDTNGYVDDINGWNFVAESNNIDDDYGHGTFVAGIIAANTDNGVGIAGVNPGAQLMTLKVGDNNGVARSLAIYRALRYAVDNGARVINISLGRKGLSRLEQIGINYAYAMGCIVVVAAGNQSGNIAEHGPPGARRAFSVASLNIDGSRRSHSNKGLMVALAAPGESIYSLTAKNGKRDGRMIPIMAGEYHRLSGTSFAAPIVAGTASLIWAKNPNLSNHQVEDMILASAIDAEDPGWDPETGMGKLNARYALAIEPESAVAPRLTEWRINKDQRGKIASVDVYGVIRGAVDSYEVAVGKGDKPSTWTTVLGPTRRLVQHGHIVRIPGDYFKKGSSWTLQLTATALDGQKRSQQVLITKKRR